MKRIKRLLTLDANVFVAALKRDELYSNKCAEILGKIPRKFLLVEPSIVYQEVCGVLARRAGLDVARKAKKLLDDMILPRLLFDCDKRFCESAYYLCWEYRVYSIDALYLRVALDAGAVLVSLDKEDFIDRIKRKNPEIEVYHVSEFPY